MGKWSWKTRASKIPEFVYAMAENDGMPTWEDLTLKQCIDELKMLLEMSEDTEDIEPYDRKTAIQIRKFLKDFDNIG